MKSESIVWLNGNLLNYKDAKISVFSPTSQFGLNVFEGIRAYWNDKKNKLFIFRLDDHINRLLDSVKLMEFNSSFSKDFLKEKLIETILANNFKLASSGP